MRDVIGSGREDLSPKGSRGKRAQIRYEPSKSSQACSFPFSVLPSDPGILEKLEAGHFE